MNQQKNRELQALFSANEAALEDFWGRKENGPRFARAFRLFGWPVELTANEPALLEAAVSVRPLYSEATPIETTPLRVHLVARRGAEEAPDLPEDLFSRIHYNGHGSWIGLDLDRWGMAWADLAAGEARAVLAPTLAAQPEAVGRFVLNTLLLNLLDGRGYSMVHATSLLRSGRLLLLLGPHNSGKSTTALRLALDGFQFIADSQIYVSPRDDALELVGFPVGRTKLRGDVLASFPGLRGLMQREDVRQEAKYGLDLRRIERASVWAQAVVDPPAIHLCLLTRHERAETKRRAATRTEMRRAVVRNSAFWHEPAIWRRHLRQLDRLVTVASCHHLTLGSDAAGVLTALEPLFHA